MPRYMRLRLTGSLALLAGCASITIAAQPTVVRAQEQRLQFDIAEQDLAEALQQFARQAGVQILFPFAEAAGKRSRAIRGDLPVRQALARLLAGHGLYVATYSEQRITLRRIERGATPRQARVRESRPEVAPAPAPAPEIVVTGRALSVPMSSSEYSYAVSSLGRRVLDREGPASTAELFRQVPGFWVESSGGEAGNNVRSRGIPTDGFSSVALAENGLPVQYDGALGYLNTDQSFRLDDTIARVEAVRGGPASLFMPSAPGGVVNFITRSGLDGQGGRLRLTSGDHGYGRLDGHLTGKIGDDLGLLLGGFYRRYGGRRRPGYTADEGGQFRAALDFANGGARASIDFRHLDDRVTFYLPVPLQLDERRRPQAIPGFDPLRDSLAGPETLHLLLSDGGVPTRFDLPSATHTRLTAVTAKATIPLSAASAWHGAFRWRNSDTSRNALFPTGTPLSGQQYLAAISERTLAAFPEATELGLLYANDGTRFPPEANGNGLVTGGNLLSVSVPLDEAIADSRLTWKMEGAGRHDLAIGVTAAHYSYRFDRYMGTVLLEVANRARLLDAVALNSDGQIVGRYTDNGVQRYGSIYDRVGMSVDALALYAADEWRVAPDLRVDFGARWETNAISGQAMGKTNFDLGDPTTLADDQVIGANGASIPIDRHFDGLGFSIGANYQPAQGVGVFARFTRAFRLPSASEFNTAPLRGDQAVVPIGMGELGLKYAGRRLSVNATAFVTHFKRLPFTDFRFDTVSNSYVERTAIADTRTLGVELEAQWQPGGMFDLALQATWQDPRYRDFAFTQLVDGEPVLRDYSDNQLIRIPRFSLRAVPALSMLDGRLRTELTVAYFSRRFSDIANAQVLPAYALVGFNAQGRLTERLSIALHVSNLTNTLGLTEGNPRAGSFDTGGAIESYFFARPEFARSVRADLVVEF